MESPCFPNNSLASDLIRLISQLAVDVLGAFICLNDKIFQPHTAVCKGHILNNCKLIFLSRALTFFSPRFCKQATSLV